jgi:hypothetical protein
MSTTLIPFYRWDALRRVYVHLGNCPMDLDRWRDLQRGQKILWAPRIELTVPADPVAPVEDAVFAPIGGTVIQLAGDRGAPFFAIEPDPDDIDRLDQIEGFRARPREKALADQKGASDD